MSVLCIINIRKSGSDASTGYNDSLSADPLDVRLRPLHLDRVHVQGVHLVLVGRLHRAMLHRVHVHVLHVDRVHSV